LLVRTLRPLRAILWLPLGVLLTAISPLIAVVCIGTLTSSRFVTFPGLASGIWTTVPVVAARFSVPAAAWVALPRLHRLRNDFRLAGQPAEYFFKDGRLRDLSGRSHRRGLRRGNPLHRSLRPLDFRFLRAGQG